MTADKPRRMPRFSLRSLILLVALAGSGYGLWYRWEPWQKSSELHFATSDAAPVSWYAVTYLHFSPNSQLLAALVVPYDSNTGGALPDQVLVWSLATHRLLFRIELGKNMGRELQFTHDSSTIQVGTYTNTANPIGSPIYVDVSEGEIIKTQASSDLDDRFQWDGRAGRYYAPNGILFAKCIYAADGPPYSARIAIASIPIVERVDIFKRVYPSAWWGVAWLPEFWLTLALSVGLLVSVVRDRKLAA